MALVTEGHQEALVCLVERHHSPLVAYLYRFSGGDRPLAEDLTQETFVRIIQQRSYQAGRPFKPWLYSVATNLARDHYKSAATRRSTPAEEAINSQKDRAPGPEEMVLAAESSHEVAEALLQIGPEYRAALLLRFYAGMSLREIAIALDVPLGTVKSRLSVGCRRLRDLLAGV